MIMCFLFFVFFFSFLSSFIVPHGEVRGGGETEERSFRLLEELVRTALNQVPDEPEVVNSALKKNKACVYLWSLKRLLLEHEWLPI